LKLRGDDDVEWREFNDDMLPPYAILSHTWGVEEVLYTDLLDGSYKSKAGFRKILFCGRQAVQDVLQYFWVDTCCIDKRNNTELTKAINSMFEWYRKSCICYAYLSDVSASGDWVGDFRKSRWFKRGWTLQELIAPGHVDFFSLQHTRLGDKLSLELEIRDITGIQIEVLRGSSLKSIPWKARFEWHKSRQTFEPEDVAYCQFGIFGVSMPLVYGEGAYSALRRLREAIVSEMQSENIPTRSLLNLQRAY